MKRRITAMRVILFLVAIPFGIAQAIENNEKEQNNKTMPVKLVTFGSDGISKTEKGIQLLNRQIFLYKKDYIYYYKFPNKNIKIMDNE